MTHFFIPAIEARVKQLWDIWNIRGAVLVSLWLQIALIFLGPIRKSSRRNVAIMLIWFTYLMADAIAIFAIGLISNCQENQSKNSSNHHINRVLLTFWAPFLLLHFGGCDTITAFALADNQLWSRHLLTLGSKVGTVVYIFIQSLDNVNNNLWFPTVLVFIAGMIKCVERTRALYLASLDRFRDSMLKDPDPGPNYAKLMAQYQYKKEANLPTRIQMTIEPDEEIEEVGDAEKGKELGDLEVVRYAYRYFKIFKGLVVDLILSIHDRDESREFFRWRKAEDALRIIEVELNFLYGALFTKVEVLYCLKGIIFRFLAFASVLVAFGIFYFQTNKTEFDKVEIKITYTLLLGAIALDVISFIMLIFSDRTFASIKNAGRLRKCLSLVVAIFNRYLALKKPRWHPCKCNIEGKHHVLVTAPFPFRRWSGVIPTHNLIKHCLESERKTTHEFISWFDIFCEKIFVFFSKKLPGPVKCISSILVCLGVIGSFISGVGKFSSFIVDKVALSCCVPVFSYITKPINQYVDKLRYVSFEPFNQKLWELIFEELKNKIEFADDPETARRISVAKGDWVLTDYVATLDYDDSMLVKSVVQIPYDESLLMWHITTDLCFYSVDESPHSEDALTHKQVSKILSDYMLYLLVFQPSVMSPVAGIGKIRFRDTVADVKRFLKRWHIQPNQERSACINILSNILSVNIDVNLADMKGLKSKSVLADAIMLSKELKIKIKPDVRWKLIGRVWVELLSYAASHCTPSTQANQVSMGGEFINFVWLLTAHFGLREHYQINKLWLLMAQYGVRHAEHFQNQGNAIGQLIAGK